jgi:transposase-like protein
MSTRAETQAWLAIHKLNGKLPICRRCGSTNMKIDGRISGRTEDLLRFLCHDCNECSGIYHNKVKNTFGYYT